MKILRILVAVGVLALAGGASGQTLTVLYSFSGPPIDGSEAQAGLIQGSDGNFYGTTRDGGASSNYSHFGRIGYGTVFRISPSGSFTNLHSFSGSDGANPLAPLVQGSDGNFYGTTYYGGTNDHGGVFRVSSSGYFTTLYSFGSIPNDGTQPQAGLVQGMDGNFYGTTFTGGASSGGTIFRISPSGNYTNVHSFGPTRNNGAYPGAGLVQGIDGNFYGMTAGGGTATSCAIGGFQGCGTAFRFSPSGTLTTLYSVFGTWPCADSAFPQSTLARGSDGNFYGTADDCVFRISPSGTFTGLYCFGSAGSNATAGLVQGSDGCFYGMSNAQLFRISASGTFASLYDSGGSGVLVQGSDGNFYGVNGSNGAYGHGTVFKLTVPLNPPANQICSAQVDASGTNLVFSIPSVAYETYQLQFSPSLSPTNWSNVDGSITSIGALVTLTNFGGALGPQGFYRFAITP